MNHGVQIERWSFWSPETRLPSEWRQQSSRSASNAEPIKIPDDAIPATIRRRMSELSRLAVQVALEATRGVEADFLVFCSQHGELARTRALLANMAAGEELSPSGFSQSVHNTSAGLYSIVSNSRAPASSLASGASTFAYGWLEAEAYLLSNPGGSALLVSYDDVLPEEYLPYSTQEQCKYALALVLRLAQRGGLRMRSVPAQIDEPLPMAPLFMAWWLSPRDAFRITADGQGWEWRRHTS